MQWLLQQADVIDKPDARLLRRIYTLTIPQLVYRWIKRCARSKLPCTPVSSVNLLSPLKQSRPDVGIILTKARRILSKYGVLLNPRRQRSLLPSISRKLLIARFISQLEEAIASLFF